MKTQNQFSPLSQTIFVALFLLFTQLNLFAQTKTMVQQKLLVMPIDIIGMSLSNYKQLEHISGVTRLYLELNTDYLLVDRYEMSKAKISIEYLTTHDLCLTNSCIIEYGKVMQADKVLSGYVESLGTKMIVSFQIINLKTLSIEKKITKEFLIIIPEVNRMIEITLNEMFDKPNNQEVLTKLTKPNDFDNAINSPFQVRLRADGPRMGFTYFTGSNSDVLRDKSYKGGYEVYPVLFQFGYQFEKQYLNEGNFQALAEFIPMVTGFDQGLFIPSFTLLNGFRSNKRGWEIAFGPSFGLVSKAKGYYINNEWQIINEENPLPEGYFEEKRMDSRGILELNTSFVIAAGRTFKSGKLNIPINLYVMPQRSGVRYGLSVGFNARKRHNS